MFVVATNDRYASVKETRTMYRAVKAGDMLKNRATGEEFGPAAAKVTAFLIAHTRG